MLGRAFGAGHFLERLWTNKAFVFDCAPKLEQVAYGGAEAQVRVIGHSVFAGLNITRSKLAVGMAESAGERKVVTIRGGFNSRGREDVLLNVVKKALPRHALHNRDQELKTGDGPVPLLAWFVDPVLARVESHDLIQGFGLAAGGFNRIAQVVVIHDSGSVIQQLPDGDMMALQR